MKFKMAANQVLKRFSGKIVKEDALKCDETGNVSFVARG